MAAILEAGQYIIIALVGLIYSWRVFSVYGTEVVAARKLGTRRKPGLLEEMADEYTSFNRGSEIVRVFVHLGSIIVGVWALLGLPGAGFVVAFGLSAVNVLGMINSRRTLRSWERRAEIFLKYARRSRKKPDTTGNH